MRLLKPFFVLVLCTVATSCGWHLRSDSQSGVALESLYVGSRLMAHERGPDSILQGLERRLNDLDIASPSKLSDAQLGLIILSEERDEKVLSLTSDLFEQQARLSKTVRYQVWRGDEMLEANAVASTYRDMTEDQSQAAAKNRETDLIYKEINADLIEQILRSLQLLTPADNEN